MYVFNYRHTSENHIYSFLFRAKLGAKRRERSARAVCLPRVVLANCKIWCAINQSFHEYMLGVRQSRHGAFCVSRQHRLCLRWPRRIFMYYSWKAVVFTHLLWNNVYHRWITNNFPSKWHRTASTASACKSSPRKIFHWNSSGERRLKFIGERIEEDNREAENIALAQRRQRRQHSDHKRVQRQRQNTTITL